MEGRRSESSSGGNSKVRKAKLSRTTFNPLNIRTFPTLLSDCLLEGVKS